MKKINYILGVLVAFLTMNSCVGDLNVTPIDPNANTADKALVNEAAFEQFLSGVYLGFATSGYYGANGSASISGLDGGASQYIRGLYHHSELTTDESVCGWNDQTIKNFHWMNWTTDDTFIYAFYSRIFMQVGMANEFIREAKASDVDFAKKQQYIDEARVLRALAYYHAIDNFGNVPFADETAVVGVNPDQIARADLYAWLEEELQDLVSNSALPEKNATVYGHVNKSVAKFLLAKLYLNAEVFAGKAAYDKCATVLADLMDDGYSLHTTSKGTYNAYQELFLADNNNCTDEIIFAVEQDGVNTTSYGATNYLIFASTGGEMDPDEMGISSGWGGLRTTPEFYGKFDANDARNLFYTATLAPVIDEAHVYNYLITNPALNISLDTFAVPMPRTATTLGARILPGLTWQLNKNCGFELYLDFLSLAYTQTKSSRVDLKYSFDVSGMGELQGVHYTATTTTTKTTDIKGGVTGTPLLTEQGINNWVRAGFYLTF